MNTLKLHAELAGGRLQFHRGSRRSVSRVLSAFCNVGRPFLWDAPCGAPRATNPGGGSKIPLLPCVAARSRPPLFGLAPGGVYPANPVTRVAVRSYRPVSPLPLAQAPLAVCFLWHFPWGRPRRPLAGTVFPWSPDFPPPELSPWQRPSNRLDFWSCAIYCPNVKPAPGKSTAS